MHNLRRRRPNEDTWVPEKFDKLVRFCFLYEGSEKQNAIATASTICEVT